MKIVDIKVGESLKVSVGNKDIIIIPQRKSGVKMRIGIEAEQDVIIGNPEKSLHKGL